MKQHKNKIIAAVLIVLVLAFTYWWGGNSAGLHGWKVTRTETAEKTSAHDKNSVQKKELSAEEKIELAQQIADEQEEKENVTGQNKESNPPETTAAQSETPAQDKQQSESKQSAVENTCTISIRCDTILNNLDYLNPEKQGIVPANGIILAETDTQFSEGDSVFDLLLKTTRENKIHMEYMSTPVYNSTYIEGIANLYEFDCGELSGWMYRVNGEFPNYGCSLYTLKSGDKVEWIYTCDLGVDIGGFNASLNN